jgi:DNA-directed RNA polymerase subunit RPC12/RpoP
MFQTKAVKCNRCNSKFKVKIGFQAECKDCGLSIVVKPQDMREANRLIKNLMKQMFGAWLNISKVSGYLNSTKEQIRLNLPSTTYSVAISYSRQIIEETLDTLKTW